MWRSLACPSTSRTLFSGLRVSTHGKQVASLLARFLLTAQGMGASGLFVCPGPARGDNRIESKKESIGIDYFIILSDGKSFHVSNTLRFKVLQDVLFGFCSQNRISNDSFGRIQTFVLSYFNWNTEERGLLFQVFSLSFSSRHNK